MSILSNYTPNCLVKAWVECDFADLDGIYKSMTGEQFAQKFQTAVKVAEIDIYRATTHNKGIFNGVDAVAIATGNDFRAIEAAGHTYAARSGKYKSLSTVEIKDNYFKFYLFCSHRYTPDKCTAPVFNDFSRFPPVMLYILCADIYFSTTSQPEPTEPW